MLIKVTIPIHNYYRNGVHYQDIYFDSNHSPTKDEVLNYLRQLSERDSQFSEYMGDWEDAMESVNNTNEWPAIGGTVLSRNTFVSRKDLEKFDPYLPLTIQTFEMKTL